MHNTIPFYMIKTPSWEFYKTGTEGLSCSFALNVSPDFVSKNFRSFHKCPPHSAHSRSNLTLLRSVEVLTFRHKLPFKSLKLGRKDSNLRDGWTKTSCLTTWRRPNSFNYYNKISRFIVKLKCNCAFVYYKGGAVPPPNY